MTQSAPARETKTMNENTEARRLIAGLRAIQSGGLWGLTNEDAFRNIRNFAGRVADGMTADQAFDAKISDTAPAHPNQAGARP